MTDIRAMLKRGCTDSEIKRVLRPVVKADFNRAEFDTDKEFRACIEKESYRRISEVRKEIKNENRNERQKLLNKIVKMHTPEVKEEGFFTYMRVGGQMVKIKVA